MKKSAVYLALLIFTFSSCELNQRAGSRDDVYAVPSEEVAKARAIADEQAKQDQLAREEAAAQIKNNQGISSTASEDLKNNNVNNPYYKEPMYSSDDYYDYQYSSRISRFYNPMGLGYYDNYYTNLYSYNQNPSCYGTSIYSNNAYGASSYGYNSFGIGIGTGYGTYGSPYYNSWGNSGWGNGFGVGCGSPYSYGYSNGSPFGYNYGFGSPYSYGYCGGINNSYSNWPYMGGYNQGYYNSNNYNGWGYLNANDPNSGYGHMVNAPRGSNGGDNSHVRSTDDVIRNTSSQGYFQEVNNQQQSRQRFSSSDQRIMRRDASVNENSARTNYINGSSSNSSSQNTDINRSGRQQNNDRIMERRQDIQAPSRREQPIFNQGGDMGGGRNRGSDAGSSPRNSGSSSRPR